VGLSALSVTELPLSLGQMLSGDSVSIPSVDESELSDCSSQIISGGGFAPWGSPSFGLEGSEMTDYSSGNLDNYFTPNQLQCDYATVFPILYPNPAVVASAPWVGRFCASDRSAALTTAFDQQLRARLQANLRQLDPRAVPLDGRRHAAVAVVVVDSDPIVHGDDPHPASSEAMGGLPGPADASLTGSVAGTAGGAAVLLTRRAIRLQSHSGQWALPGGRVEAGEEALGAARRELHEELGLAVSDTALLGRLDDYPTRSGYVITPLVFWGGAEPALEPDPREVRSVHRVSFRELCRPDSPRFVSIPESDRPVVQVPVGGDLIHAPTGAILLQFRRVAIEGVIERVAHYEQPVFAWR
jgi:8-oxo-dGTP pyrophosphatase MutT (NUDIX family)